MGGVGGGERERQGREERGREKGRGKGERVMFHCFGALFAYGISAQKAI